MMLLRSVVSRSFDIFNVTLMLVSRIIVGVFGAKTTRVATRVFIAVFVARTPRLGAEGECHHKNEDAPLHERGVRLFKATQNRARRRRTRIS